MRDRPPARTRAALDGADLTDLFTYRRGFPHELFARHRSAAPVLWHDASPHTPDGEGFWSVATYRESLDVLLAPDRFSSEGGGDRPRGGSALADSSAAGKALNMTDDPRHRDVRRQVSPRFTPRAVGVHAPDLRVRVGGLLDAASTDRFDVVDAVARPVALVGVAAMLGLHDDEATTMWELVDAQLSRGRADAKTSGDTPMDRLRTFVDEIAAERTAEPPDDFFGDILRLRGTPDRVSLDDDEIWLLVWLVFTASTESVANLVAASVHALMRRPDAWRELREGRVSVVTAVEELLRWTSPAGPTRRTATATCELAGASIRAGEKVVVWEASANRDGLVFDAPDELDLARAPNPHLGFGFGSHFCLGAALSRLELRIVLEEMLRRYAAVEPDGAEQWSPRNKLTALSSLPVRVTADDRRA